MSEDRVPYDSQSTTKAPGTVETAAREAIEHELKIEEAMDKELITLEVIKLQTLPQDYFAKEWRKTYRHLVVLAEAAIIALGGEKNERIAKEHCSEDMSVSFDLTGTCFNCLQRMLKKQREGGL